MEAQLQLGKSEKVIANDEADHDEETRSKNPAIKCLNTEMLGKVLVCGAAIPPSIKFFSIVNQLSRHKELAPLYDWALLHTSFEDKKAGL